MPKDDRTTTPISESSSATTPERIEHTIETLVAQRIHGIHLATKTSTITTSCAGIPVTTRL